MRKVPLPPCGAVLGTSGLDGACRCCDDKPSSEARTPTPAIGLLPLCCPPLGPQVSACAPVFHAGDSESEREMFVYEHAGFLREVSKETSELF